MNHFASHKGASRLLPTGPLGSKNRTRLLEECIRFARQAGYGKTTLWTQSILHAARHIYKQQGFQIVREEQHHGFGKDLTAETWELDLAA